MTSPDPREREEPRAMSVKDLIEVALTAFDPQHPKHRDNLATKVAGTIALRRAASAIERQGDPSTPQSPCPACGSRSCDFSCND